MTRMREAIDEAAATLAAAGIGSPRVDAVDLAAEAASTDRGRVALIDTVTDDVLERYRELIAARSRRIPVQHLVGTAAFGPVQVRVGPGVFIPRPETESLLEWALAQPLGDHPLKVDLCTGSGALALALARIRPDARVIAVDDSEAALEYAAQNLAGTGVELVHADVTVPGLLPDLSGRVDLIVANPPYIPDGAVLEPEVADHDPAHALFGGPDGMAVIRPIVDLAARLLRPGGRCGIEHDDTTSAQTVSAFADHGGFTDPVARRDLAGRPRFVTATRRPTT
ncbi:peptide chain release factor N(5)-glutamine methyltransferase [Mycobacterium sp. CPCC 205372]|uniref:Release factor glutamine methyltransferase n=1 Tax=Mycobacterium hippophais TaxID=3016340 RepID=A0ABT4PKZ3_9MYCO|nr:peptide chain release factor N(5)-glutamine methyltransferase [Mycobacterium hippophais]MCZ8377248.1 peptide chain release factor N(5)-glutamine methyltransferase [Mycobacterium hippophais]